MRKKQVVICDSNKEYAMRLQEYVKERKTMPFGMAFYTEKDKFLEYVKRERPEVCVISEDCFKREDFVRSVEKNTTRILRICEEKEEVENQGIYRYVSGDVFIKELCRLGELSPQDGVNRNKIGKTKLVGVYTPIGRCLQTSFALVLGQMLASKYQVLYLNFEAYSGFAQMLQKNFNKDMADLLYYFRNLSGEFSEQYHNMKQSINGLDYIPPAFSYMDISGVTPEEWREFLDTLGKCGDYDYIILDLTDAVQGLYQLLRASSYVYTITRNDGMALAKISHYENILRELSYIDVLDKTKKCSFPIYRQLPIGAEELLYSQLADYARKILREDFGF